MQLGRQMVKSGIPLQLKTNEARFLTIWALWVNDLTIRNIRSYTLLSSLKSTYAFCLPSLTLHCFQDLIISEA